ncbi:hypothetical protein [Dongia sp.]|uniref:hypothetical protein n=1 Tax=Dongia sp. TaxID=1977262 RepID=UPI0035B09CC9
MTENASSLPTADAEQAGHGAGIVAVVFLSIIALLGVFLFSRSVTGGFALFGGLLAVFAILLLFRIIALLYPSQH